MEPLLIFLEGKEELKDIEQSALIYINYYPV